MIINAKVTHCDFTDRRYDRPVDGAACLAQGATGRWCEVLWIGPEHVAEAGVKTITREEAIQQIGNNGTIDF